MEALLKQLIALLTNLFTRGARVRVVEFVDRPLDTPNVQEVFKTSDRIIGISIKNQGAATATISMGTTSPTKRLLTDEETEYGNIAGGMDIVYIKGSLKYAFGSGAAALVMTVVYDRGLVREDQIEC